MAPDGWSRPRSPGPIHVVDPSSSTNGGADDLVPRPHALPTADLGGDRPAGHEHLPGADPVGPVGNMPVEIVPAEGRLPDRRRPHRDDLDGIIGAGEAVPLGVGDVETLATRTSHPSADVVGDDRLVGLADVADVDAVSTSPREARRRRRRRPRRRRRRAGRRR